MQEEAPFIEHAYWLSFSEKKALTKAFQEAYLKELARSDKIKLACLLCSILFAEEFARRIGKKRTLLCEWFLKKLRLHAFFCSTIGMWNFNIRHASRFGFSKKEFRSLLLDNEKATSIVAKHILEDIKLKKPPQFIFAEYNYNAGSTSVVALQKALNQLARYKKKYSVCEDGIIGPDTKEALDRSSPFLPPFFSVENLDEETLLKTLKYFEIKHGVVVKPFVPQVIVKRDVWFLLNVLIKALKDIRKIKRLRAFFERDMHVPRFVAVAMQAYEHLRKKD